MRLVDYLMANPLYVGVRVEIASRFVRTNKNLVKKYNSSHKNTQLFDLHRDGKIAVEKDGIMLIARGAKPDKGPTGLVNFSVMAEIKSKKRKDIERIVQIVNVLGNDRLIRERVHTFVGGRSLLNAISELAEIKNAFVELDTLIPGFVKAGWYYAPEAKF